MKKLKILILIFIISLISIPSISANSYTIKSTKYKSSNWDYEAYHDFLKWRKNQQGLSRDKLLEEYQNQKPAKKYFSPADYKKETPDYYIKENIAMRSYELKRCYHAPPKDKLFYTKCPYYV